MINIKTNITDARNLIINGKYELALQNLRDIAEIEGINAVKSDIEFCKGKLARNYNIKESCKISVIIPTFNSAGTIERAIKSVLSQSLEEVEIICYDDGSQDDTLSILYGLADQYPQIKVFHDNENIGQGKRRNQAVMCANGKYITYLDADDYYNDNNFFSDIYKICIDGGFDVVITPYQREKAGKITKDKIEEAKLNGRQSAQRFISRDFGTHAPGAKFFKRIIAQNTFFVDYGYSQDVSFIFKSLLKADKVIVIKKYGYVYYNDNFSCWRPPQLTIKHFYSSLRLLSEIIIEILKLNRYSVKIDISEFINIWKNEHGQRIKKFIDSSTDQDEILFIIDKLYFIKPFLIHLLKKMINCQIFYTKKKGLEPASYSFFKDYIAKLESEFNRYALSVDNDISDRELIVIYSMNLSYGGLQKVASQVGNILSKKYEIIFIVDTLERDSFLHMGRILKNDILNPDILKILSSAKYIFDFKFKEEKNEEPLCMYCTLNFAAKYIATIHNTDTCANYFQKILLYLQDKKIENIHKIICVSKQVKNSFELLYGKHDNIHVLYNPVDFKQMDSAPVEDNNYGKYILFLGRLNATRQKGLDILFRAYALSSIRGKCKLVLAGEGDFDRRMTHIIDYYSLQNDLLKIGFNDNISSLLKNSLFLGAPSRWEGFSLSIIESLACGVPVLTTRVGGAEEVVTHLENGYFCETDNVKSTINGLEYLYKHHLELKKNCRKSVEWLNLADYERKLHNILLS